LTPQPLWQKGNTAKIGIMDTLEEDYITLFDLPDLEDENITVIDSAYLEIYSKTVSNEPHLTKKDNSFCNWCHRHKE
jgi:hypothetical protein